MEPLLLTVNEACEMLRISRSRLYALLGAGVLKGALNGRRRCFGRSEVAAVAARIATEGAPSAPPRQKQAAS